MSRVAHQPLWGWVMIAPCLLGLLVLTYGPTVCSVALSFAQWDLLGPIQWVGWANFMSLWHDARFWNALNNTLVFVAIAATLETILALGLALLLTRPLPLQALWRSLFLIPYMTPLVGMAVVWGWLFAPDAGFVNVSLETIQQGVIAFGQGLGVLSPTQAPWVRGMAWLHHPHTAMGVIILMKLWKSLGYTALLFVAALQAIPESLPESAALDGATGWQHFWRITLPMISPTLFFVVTMLGIIGFQTFDAVYLLTQGGPNHSTDMVVYWLFKNSFEFYNIGLASAQAIVLFGVVMVLTGAQWWAKQHWVLHEDTAA